MKTKANEIPLVGPRGRKELIERVRELEEKLDKAFELANAQSDWEQSDSTAPDYIKNKPEISGIKTFPVSYSSETDGIGLNSEQSALVRQLIENGELGEYWAEITLPSGKEYAKVISYASDRFIVARRYHGSPDLAEISVS